MKPFVILILLNLVYLTSATTYYVDVDAETGGNGTSPSLTGPNAAWQDTRDIVGIQPGDTILFERGDIWDSYLPVKISGEPNTYITYGAYGAGEKPLIDVSQSQVGVPAIWIRGVDYVEVRDFRLKGNGGFGVVDIRHGTEKPASGAMGTGYTITIRNIDILSNYGASSGNHDGFSVRAKDTSDSSQVLFYNISATKCRHETEPGGSHQCLTLHQNSKAKVYGAVFSDSVSWYAATNGSQVEFYNIYADSPTAGGLVATDSATQAYEIYVTDSTLIANHNAKLFTASSASSLAGDRIIIENSKLIAESTSPTANAGNVKLKHCEFVIHDPNWLFSQVRGTLTLEDNKVVYGGPGQVSNFVNLLSQGRVIATGNLFEIVHADNSLFYVRMYASAFQSDIQNNIFTHVHHAGQMFTVADDAVAPRIINNTFYSPSSGGVGVRLLHNGDEPEGHRLILHNNIFYNLQDAVIHSDAAVMLSNYNCYDHTPVLMDAYFITQDPCFVNPDANDFHLQSQGWRYDPEQGWTWDSTSSRCIDAGNPQYDLADEPLHLESDPTNRWGVNRRINQGAYGGTSQASMAPQRWALRADLNNDGTVNTGDLIIFLSMWLGQDSFIPADFNRNGVVEMVDFNILADDWHRETLWHSGANPINIDLVRDNHIDFSDYAFFTSYWLTSDCNLANRWCEHADTDHNTKVDQADLAPLIQEWLKLY